MKAPLTLLLTLGLLLAAAPAPAQNPPPAPAQALPVVIRNATVHVGDGQTVLENTDLLLTDGTITRIGPELTAPDNAVEMDATGKQVYPGLIAMNSQLGLTEIGAVRATNDQREVGRFNPNARALIAFNTDSQVIPTVRSRGVLLTQAVPQGSLVAGRSAVMQLDGWNFEDAAVRGDEGIHIHWPSRNSYNWQTGDLKPNPDYAEQVGELTAFLQQAAGYCARPADDGGDRLVKLESFCQALAGDATAYLHADEARDIQAGVLLLKKLGAAPVVMGGHQAYLITDFLKREGVAVVLASTQSLPANSDSPIDQPYRNPALLAEAGVDFVIAHEGYWQQRNLPFVAGQAVGFGLPYERALEAVTLSPARVLGIDGKYGSLAEGKSATLLIVNGDLLDMRSSKVEYAFIDGRSINLENKQSVLARKFRQKYARQQRR